jgi:hypothetical protein
VRHNAYERLARAGGCADGPGGGRRPGPYPHTDRTAPLPPVPPPVHDRTAEPVCARCGTWSSCCFCSADVAAMRTALRRIAEIHSSCGPDCPERRRLAAVPRGHR